MEGLEKYSYASGLSSTTGELHSTWHQCLSYGSIKTSDVPVSGKRTLFSDTMVLQFLYKRDNFQCCKCCLLINDYHNVMQNISLTVYVYCSILLGKIPLYIYACHHFNMQRSCGLVVCRYVNGLWITILVCGSSPTATLCPPARH